MPEPRTAIPNVAGSRGALDRSIVVVLAATVCFVTWRLRDVYPDDALIVLRYVANILSGAGWTYNVGEAVNATTSPLHVMFLAILGTLLGGDLLAAQTLGFALPTVATVAIAHRTFRWSGGIPAAMAALLVAFGPNRYSTLGMESSLLLACALGTIAAYEAGKLKSAAMLLGLAILARPDAGLLALVLAVDALIRRHAAQVISLAIGATLVTAPWVTFALLSFGTPFPNTLAIKLAQRHLFGDGPIFLEGAWSELSAVDVRGVGVGAATVAVILALAVATTVARARTHRVPALFAAWAALQFGAYAALGLPPYHWYYAPALLAAALALAVAFETLWNAPRHRPAWMPLGVLTTAATIAVSFPEIVAPQPTLPHYRHAGAWIAQNTPEILSVACSDIGIVGYLAQPRRVIDMQGLVTPGASAAIGRGDTDWWFGPHEPDFVLVHVPAWRDFEAPVLANPLFRDTYRPVPTPGLRGIQVYAKRTN